MIEVSGLVKRYGSFEAVRGVSFSVGSGRVVGLLGPNGAGKTTIMKVLTAYHRPSAGTARLDGIDVALDPLAVKRIVGYLPEGVPLYLDMTVAEYLGFVADARGLGAGGQSARRKDAIDKAIVACGLSGFADVRMERLSKGYRQRVGLAQAIVHDPAILILDEPTTGLDPNQILEIRALIRSLGAEKTVILSTHILQEVEALCSEVLIINEGSIAAQGSASDIAASLEGEERIECRLLSAGRAPELGALTQAASIVSAAPLEEDGARWKLVVKARRGAEDEAAAAVFDWAVASGLRLVEMRRERLSMEDIFVRLTGEEARR